MTAKELNEDEVLYFTKNAKTSDEAVQTLFKINV